MVICGDDIMVVAVNVYLLAYGGGSFYTSGTNN